jgi:F-type H+-transporting ATPase subunit epsilon
MAMTIHVDIASPEESIFSGAANMVFAPAYLGEVGISPRHSPLLTRLIPGEIRIQTDGGDEKSYYVSGGILEVQPHMVTVLADTAVRAKDLDEAAAEEARKRAEQALEDRNEEMDLAIVEAQLAEAIAQLRVLERYRKRAGR